MLISYNLYHFLILMHRIVLAVITIPSIFSIFIHMFKVFRLYYVF